MSEQEILKIARSENPAPIEDCCHHFTRQELITFARRIQAAQKEKDAGICDLHAEGWKRNPGNDPLAGYIASNNCAAAIREQSDE